MYDDTEKDSFIGLPLSGQLNALFDMLRYVRSEISSIKKNQIEFEEELREFRRKREVKEEKSFIDTTEKIHAIMEAAEARKFNWSIYLRDRVMPQVITLIVLAVLYMTFGNRLP